MLFPGPVGPELHTDGSKSDLEGGQRNIRMVKMTVVDVQNSEKIVDGQF